MKIKEEFIGVRVSHKGNNVNVSADNYTFCESIGLGYMFEEPTVSELKVVKYKAIKPPIPEPKVTEEDGTEAE